MAITKSAKKAAKRSVKLYDRNKEVKIRMKIHMKKFFKNLSKGDEVSLETVNSLYKFIDKAAKIGVIKKQNAANKKSKIALTFNKNTSKQ